MALLKTFEEIVDDQSVEAAGLEYLPLCHTTIEESAWQIAQKHKLLPRLCPRKKEELLYFFYGKSSYVVEGEADIYVDSGPITFICNMEGLVNDAMKYLLPFDSGGFKRYEMGPEYKPETFTHFSPDSGKAKGMVRLVYRNNVNYLNNEVDFETLKNLKEECGELTGLIKAYERAMRGESRVGDQLYSIELQYCRELEFKPLIAVVPFDRFTSRYWSTNFHETYPTASVEHYGALEISASKGMPLKAGKYEELMVKKVNDIVLGLLSGKPLLPDA